MVEYYKNLVKKYGTQGQLKGYFLKSVAIVYEEKVFSFDFKVHRVFSSTSSKIIDEGYPLESIQIIPNLNKFKSELSEEEQIELFEYILKSLNSIKENYSRCLLK